MASDKVQIKIEISEATEDTGRKVVWLEGYFTAKVPKGIAQQIPAPYAVEAMVREAEAAN